MDALAADGEAWALLDGRSLWRRDDGHWQEIASTGDLRGRCVLAGPRVLVGTARARLLRLDGRALAPVEGFDAAEGRD
ncbi:MAG TPA: hypothetical protein VHL78_08615, partial [Actinomycetota bacterium]|nr:hypothetical protein [Actinomycetota bacterium]